MTPPIYDKPFQRLIRSPLHHRRTHTRDPRLTVPRVGYKEHLRRDDDFWKSCEPGQEQVRLPTYSKEKFCEGFDLTALDFYIVRYRLCVLLYRDGLWLKKQKENKQAKPEVEFHYTEVEDKIAKHVLLSGRHVHPYWRNKMISEFVSKTAEWMRSKKMALVNSDGENVSYSLVPNLTLISPAWTWGPTVKKLRYDSKKYERSDRLGVYIRASGSLGDYSENIRLPEIVDKGHLRETITIKDCEYNLLANIVMRKFKVNITNKDYALTYYNPYWGNELLSICDDDSLHVAIETLQVKGVGIVTFIVSPSRSSGSMYIDILSS
jgi:hypothetical protein